MIDSNSHEHRLLALGLDPETSLAVDQVLQETGGRRQPVATVSDCMGHLEREEGSFSLLVDLDGIPLDDRFFRHLLQLKPDCAAIVLSNRTYHPELKEAMRRNVFAILRKPCSSEELRICLKTVLEKQATKPG